MLADRGGLGGGRLWGNQLSDRRTRSGRTKVSDTTCIELQFPAPQHNALSVFKDL